MTANDERILDIIARHGPESLTLDEIAARSELHRNTVHDAVKRLENSGRLTRSVHGRAGTTYEVIDADD